MQDQDGDENWHVYAVNLVDNSTKDLTPLANVAAQIEEVSERAPDEILIGLNDRDQQFHDIYRVDIITGQRKLVAENKQGFAGYLTDDDLKIRFAMQYLPDGGNVILKPNDSGGWDDYMKVPMADTLTTQPSGFDKTGNVMYLIDSRDRNTGRADGRRPRVWQAIHAGRESEGRRGGRDLAPDREDDSGRGIQLRCARNGRFSIRPSSLTLIIWPR